MTAPFRLEPLGNHNRSSFTCGVEALDRYFQQQVTQDIRRRVTACYVAVDSSTERIAGFYTLAAAGVLLTSLPQSLAKKLPRYPFVPVARLGRLAINKEHQGRKLGSALLWDAIERALRSEIAVHALIVDAKDDNAEAFYVHHGFMSFNADSKQLVLPLDKLARKQ
jgi:GNAT superfamily N-acetyltransferase